MATPEIMHAMLYKSKQDVVYFECDRALLFLDTIAHVNKTQDLLFLEIFYENFLL